MGLNPPPAPEPASSAAQAGWRRKGTDVSKRESGKAGPPHPPEGAAALGAEEGRGSRPHIVGSEPRASGPFSRGRGGSTHHPERPHTLGTRQLRQPPRPCAGSRRDLLHTRTGLGRFFLDRQVLRSCPRTRLTLASTTARGCGLRAPQGNAPHPASRTWPLTIWRYPTTRHPRHGSPSCRQHSRV